MRSIFSILALLLSSCAHNVKLNELRLADAPVGELRNKAVMIVIDSDRIQDGHTTTSDVQTLNFSGVREGIGNALKMRISKNAKRVEICHSKQRECKGEFDVFLYPELKIRSVNDFWNMRCLAQFKLIARSRQGQQLGVDQSEVKKTFGATSPGQQACTEALSDAVNSVADKVLGPL